MEKSAQMYGLDPSLAAALYAHQQQVHNQMTWQWFRKKLADKNMKDEKTAKRVNCVKTAQATDVVPPLVGALAGSGIGAVLGWQIAKNRKKNKIKGMILGQIAGGIGGSAAASYGPLLF